MNPAGGRKSSRSRAKSEEDTFVHRPVASRAPDRYSSIAAGWYEASMM
jgi:hypothetical protein